MKKRSINRMCIVVIMLLLFSNVYGVRAVYAEDNNGSDIAAKEMSSSDDNNANKVSNDEYSLKTVSSSVSVNQTYTNKSMAKDSKTYFNFSVSNRGSVTLTAWVLAKYDSKFGLPFDLSIVSSDHQTCYMDGTAAKLEDYETAGGTAYVRITLGKVRLAPGTYALEANNRDWQNNIPLNFKLTYVNESNAPNIESEFNNTRNTADTILRNQTYTGNSNYKDVDYYKVSIPSADDVTITLKTKEETASSGNGNNTVELLDANGNVVIENFGHRWTTPIEDENGVEWRVLSETKYLNAGQYYVRIKGDDWYDYYYNVRCQEYVNTFDYYVSVNDNSAFSRKAGKDRYATAIAVADELKSKLGTSGKFNNIIVASGENYPDALAGSYLAKKKKAPILLVSRDVKNENMIASYIESNITSSGKVYILGGSGVVTDRFYNSIANLQGSSKVVRLWGKNRYETNDSILREAGISTSDKDLIICTGNGYADSLSASSLGKPIVLVDKSIGNMQKKYLSNSNIENVYLIGGSGVISNRVMNDIRDNYYNLHVSRLAGANRYETSAVVANKFFHGRCSSAVVAYGMNFPDGLSGGPLAMVSGSPLLLADKSVRASSAVINFCNAESVKGGYVLGGSSYVNQEVLNKMIGR